MVRKACFWHRKRNYFICLFFVSFISAAEINDIGNVIGIRRTKSTKDRKITFAESKKIFYPKKDGVGYIDSEYTYDAEHDTYSGKPEDKDPKEGFIKLEKKYLKKYPPINIKGAKKETPSP